MYKVFVNKSLIVLTDKTGVLSKKGTEILVYKNEQQLKELAELLERDKPNLRVVITHFDIDELWSSFVNQFHYVQAAGGLVFNRHGEFLMIHRNDKWDLPKGHLKKGERPEYGGMREVEEECGIDGIEITGHLANTFHMYERNGMVLKKTFWYKMKSNYSGKLVPQLEEGIDIVEWKTPKEVKVMMKKSYPIISQLLKKGIRKPKA